MKRCSASHLLCLKSLALRHKTIQYSICRRLNPLLFGARSTCTRSSVQNSGRSRFVSPAKPCVSPLSSAYSLPGASRTRWKLVPCGRYTARGTKIYLARSSARHPRLLDNVPDIPLPSFAIDKPAIRQTDSENFSTQAA